MSGPPEWRYPHGPGDPGGPGGPGGPGDPGSPDEPGESSEPGGPAESGRPKFGRLLIVLVLAVSLIVAITFGSEAYFS